MEVRSRYINVLKKTMKKTLITYLKPTYLWCFSPDPEITGYQLVGTSTLFDKGRKSTFQNPDTSGFRIPTVIRPAVNNKLAIKYVAIYFVIN